MAEHEEHHDEGGGHKSHKGGHHGGGGHAEGEHEGAPEWLISFADNVALLMGFFVILLAMNMKAPQAGGIGGVDGPHSPQPSKQWLDLVIAIREAFHSRIDMNSTDPREAHLRQRLLERQQDPNGDSVRPGPDGVKNNQHGVRTSDWNVPTASIPFEFGSNELSETSKQATRRAAHEMAGKLNIIIEVRGNVSAAEAKRDHVKGYMLAYQRAMAVATILQEEGVPWRHMRLVSCSDASPVKLRADTMGEHRTNQRVELVIIQELPEPDPFAEAGSANQPH